MQSTLSFPQSSGDGRKSQIGRCHSGGVKKLKRRRLPISICPSIRSVSRSESVIQGLDETKVRLPVLGALRNDFRISVVILGVAVGLCVTQAYPPSQCLMCHGD